MANPGMATEAVLKPSDAVDASAKEVSGVNFDSHKDHDITVNELLEGMTNMGFQASGVAESVRIVNDMVGPFSFRARYLLTV